MRKRKREDATASVSELFTIDKTRWGTLCDQIADGFRNAIAAGVYKPGDMLPQMRDLAVHFGVSIRVVVRAFAKLADEQLVVGRPRVGCRVLAPRSSLWKGLVILIVPGGDYVYNTNIRVGRVSDRLAREGYMVQRVTVPALGRRKFDFRCLDLLLRQSAALVVVFDNQPVIERHLAGKGVRFVVAGNMCSAWSKCAGCVTANLDSALGALSNHVKKAGIRRVTVVGANYNDLHPLVLAAIRAAGASVEEWKVKTGVHVSGRLDAIQSRARDLVRAKLADGGKLPDLFVFVDEYRAAGGVLALYEAGVRIPEDVKVVSVSNVGNGPVLRNGVARIEFDPFVHGDYIGDVIVKFLAFGRFPKGAEYAPQYIPDETFPA